jgi:hypothetical protein
MSESSGGLFEGTQHLILQKLRWRVGIERELTLSLVMIV